MVTAAKELGPACQEVLDYSKDDLFALRRKHQSFGDFIDHHTRAIAARLQKSVRDFTNSYRMHLNALLALWSTRSFRPAWKTVLWNHGQYGSHRNNHRLPPQYYDTRTLRPFQASSCWCDSYLCLIISWQ